MRSLETLIISDCANLCAFSLLFLDHTDIDSWVNADQLIWLWKIFRTLTYFVLARVFKIRLNMLNFKSTVEILTAEPYFYLR